MRLLPRARAAARGALPVPGISTFLQLNVRTYVRGPDGLPGVWFFSIDASSRLAALGVRRIYHVPAFHARMTLGAGGRLAGGRVRADRRAGPGLRGALPARPARRFHAEPGSLEWFLTERYRLFAARRASRDAPRPLAAQPGGGGGRAVLDRAVRARRRSRTAATSPSGRTRSSGRPSPIASDLRRYRTLPAWRPSGRPRSGRCSRRSRSSRSSSVPVSRRTASASSRRRPIPAPISSPRC